MYANPRSAEKVDSSLAELSHMSMIHPIDLVLAPSGYLFHYFCEHRYQPRGLRTAQDLKSALEYVGRKHCHIVRTVVIAGWHKKVDSWINLDITKCFDLLENKGVLLKVYNNYFILPQHPDERLEMVFILLKKCFTMEWKPQLCSGGQKLRFTDNSNNRFCDRNYNVSVSGYCEEISKTSGEICPCCT